MNIDKQLQDDMRWVSNKKWVLFVLFFSMALLSAALVLIETKSRWGNNTIAGFLIVASILLIVFDFWLLLKEITRTKKESKDLEQQKAHFGTSLNSITEGLITTGKNGEILFMNPPAERITGWKNGEVKNLPLQKVYNVESEETGRPFENIVNRILREGRTIEMENNTILNTKDFDKLIVTNGGSPLFDVNGDISGSVLVFNDVTEKKKIEDKLYQREKQYRDLIQNLPVAVYTCDEFGYIQLYNKAAVALWGREPVAGNDQWCGSWKIFTTDAEAWPIDSCPMAITLKEKRAVHGKHIMIQRPDGSYRHVLPYPTPLFDANGKLTGAVNMLIDITDKKEKEILIKQTEEKYRNLIEQASDAVIIYSFDGTIYEFNKAAYILSGHTCEEFEKLRLPDLLFDEPVIISPAKAEKIKAGETVLLIRRMKRKDGTALEIEINVRMLPDGHNLAFVRDITERIKAQKALQESEIFNRSILTSISTHIAVIDEEGTILAVNKAWDDFSINNREASLKRTGSGSNYFEVCGQAILAGDKTAVDALTGIKKVLKKEIPFFEMEYPCHLPSEKRWFLMRVTNFIGNEPKVVTAHTDITARKHSEMQRQIALELYDTLAKATSDTIWDLDMVSNKILYNEGITKMMGYKKWEVEDVADWWKQKIHPDDLGIVLGMLDKIIKNREQTFHLEYRFHCADGSYKDIFDRAFVIYDEQGKPTRIIGAMQNVTEKKMAEQELKKLSIIAKQTSNAVIITDIEERITWVNEAFTRITEYELAEVIGKRPGDFLQGPETNPAVVRLMRRKVAAFQPFECDVINYTKSGKKYCIRIQCQPEFDATGKITGFFSIQTDITKEKEAEEAIKASEERYRYLFDNNASCIMIWDLDNLGILEVNENATKQYGYNREEFLQLNLLNLRLPEDHSRINELAEQLKSDSDLKPAEQWKNINKAGEIMYMQIVSHSIYFKDRRVIMTMSDNVTEKMQLEQEVEKEKIKKQQEITEAVISTQENERQHIGRELHDNINQILASSRLYLGMAKTDENNKAGLMEETDNLINSAISEIRSLSHSLISPSLNASELIGALEQIIITANETTGLETIEDFTSFDENKISDKFKLTIYRIVQEQFNNINKYAGAKTVQLKLQQQKDELVLSIKDDGVGFDTLKKVSGVGLMNIRTRASLFNGEVSIISSPGNGCELLVTIPFITT